MADVISTGILNRKDFTTLTIASGSVDATQELHIIAPESGSTDTLDTIKLTNIIGLSSGSTVYRPKITITAAPGATITLGHQTGNISFSSGTNFDLTDSTFLQLFYNGTYWWDTVSPSAAITIPVPISQGGTGQTTADAAYNALLNANANYVRGFELSRISNSVLAVGAGSAFINGKLVTSATQTNLDLATAANWIGGSSLESADEWVHVYQDNAGNKKFSENPPQYSAPQAANRVATMQVNQSGWNGTSGLGLNATSVVYDNGTTGDAVTAGMWALIYSDSGYTLGRGKSSGASSSVNYLAVAKITATTAGAATGTLTLEAGHQIALNDDDWIVVIESGLIDHRYDNSIWYRHIDAWWNDGSSNLLDLSSMTYNVPLRRLTKNSVVAENAGNWTTTSTSFVDIDSTIFSLDVTTTGSDLLVLFHGTIYNNTATGTQLDITVNGARYVGESGTAHMYMQDTSNARTPISLSVRVPVLAGTHTVRMQWSVNAGTATMLSAGIIHPIFTVMEQR